MPSCVMHVTVMKNRFQQTSYHSDNKHDRKLTELSAKGELVSQILQCMFCLPATPDHNIELSAVTSPHTSTHNCLWPELQQSIHLKARTQNQNNIHHSCLAGLQDEWPVIPTLWSQKNLGQFPLSCPASLNLFLFWHLHTVLLVPLPPALLPGFCSSGHSQGDLLSVMFWSPPLQTRVSPSPPSLSVFSSWHQNQPAGGVSLQLPGTILFSEEYSLGVGCRNSLIMIFRSISSPPSIGSFLPQGPYCSILGMTLQPPPPPHYKSNGVLTSHRRVIWCRQW